MADELQFVCAECGKHFAADPDSMRELMIGPDLVSDGEAAEACESGEAIDRDDLEAMDADELAAIGLTPEKREALLRGEHVAVGGICLCTECQDRLAAEQETAN